MWYLSICDQLLEVEEDLMPDDVHFLCHLSCDCIIWVGPYCWWTRPSPVTVHKIIFAGVSGTKELSQHCWACEVAVVMFGPKWLVIGYFQSIFGINWIIDKLLWDAVSKLLQWNRKNILNEKWLLVDNVPPDSYFVIVVGPAAHYKITGDLICCDVMWSEKCDVGASCWKCVNINESELAGAVTYNQLCANTWMSWCDWCGYERSLSRSIISVCQIIWCVFENSAQQTWAEICFLCECICRIGGKWRGVWESALMLSIRIDSVQNNHAGIEELLNFQLE